MRTYWDWYNNMSGEKKEKTTMRSILLILLACISFVRPVLADTNVSDYNAFVTAGTLNVRSGPGTGHSIISSLSNGRKVRVTHHNGVWRRIVWHRGLAVYVHGAYLRKNDNVIPSGDSDVTDYNGTITASSLNVRSGPGIDYSIIGKKTKGKTVSVTHSNGVWLRIAWLNGAKAYVHGSYVLRIATNPTPPRKFTYVALGDSYAAGSGLANELGKGNFDKDNKCMRHTAAYPAKLNEHIAGPKEFVFKACSGDKLDDAIFQVNAAKNALAKADLVTVTIGGNDLEWPNVIKRCFTFWGRFKWSCTHGEADLEERIDKLIPRLRTFYTNLRKQAPGAEILIVGYPHVAPANPKKLCIPFTTPAINVPGLPWWFPPIKAIIDKDEREMIRRLGQRLNNRLWGIASELDNVELIDLSQTYDGHEPCTDDEWINSLLKNPKHPQSFHPKAIGHEMAAETIRRRRL